MIALGLVGYPLAHSLSPILHKAALDEFGLDGKYELYPVQPDDENGLKGILSMVRDGELTGLNVTIPHKQTVIPLVDELTKTAQAIGAVNTVLLKDSCLVGENTDAPGFIADLKKIHPIFHKKRAMVIGSGGGARAVTYALLYEDWNVTIAALLLNQAEKLAGTMKEQFGVDRIQCIPNDGKSIGSLVENVSLVVNASPIGMFPQAAQSPWPCEVKFPEGAVFYDLVYNPRETLVVKLAREAGLCATTGLGMLVEQAGLAFECWTGKKPSRERMYRELEGKC
jgi:shikimate dehydrogenase